MNIIYDIFSIEYVSGKGCDLIWMGSGTMSL